MSIRIDLPIASSARVAEHPLGRGIPRGMMLLRSLLMMASSDDSTTLARWRNVVALKHLIHVA